MNIYEQAAQKAWDAIISKVRELDKSGMKRADISRLLGHKGRSTVTNWLDEDSVLKAKGSFSDILRYLDILGLDINEFLPSSTIKRPGAHAPTELVNGANLTAIPVIGSTGAGNDVELFSAVPDLWIQVLPQYAHPGVIGLVVAGDSMEPTIFKGAIVGITPYDGSLNPGGIYLIHRPPWGRTLKRVKEGENGQIVLYSDNPQYPPYNLPDEGYEQIIIGKVVWIWQAL